jgi:hypothetical protein
MKIRMLQSMAAADWSLMPGEVVERSAEICHAWIANGIAAPVGEVQVERAVAIAKSAGETIKGKIPPSK